MTATKKQGFDGKTVLARALHRSLVTGETFTREELGENVRTAWLGEVFADAGDQRLRLSPSLGLTLGIAVGYETVSAVFLAPSGEVLASYLHPRHARDQLHDPELVSERVAHVVREALVLAHRAWPDFRGDGTVVPVAGLPVLGCTISLPLWIDRGGVPRGSVYDEAWIDRDGEAPAARCRIRGVVEAAVLGFVHQADRARVAESVHVTNLFSSEALAAAYDRSPERVGVQSAATPVADRHRWRDLFLVHVGCGVGSARVSMAPRHAARAPEPRTEQFSFLHSRLHRGESGVGGAIGHLSVGGRVDRAKLPSCTCGKDADDASIHLEQVVSGYAVARRNEPLNAAAQSNKRKLGDIPWLMAARARDDGWFLREEKRVAEAVGRAMGPIITMFDPALIVTAGFFGGAGFKAALRSAATTAGPLPVGRFHVGDANRDETLYLAARGAALGAMRNLLWRRWPGYSALDRPEPIDFAALREPCAYLAQHAIRLRNPSQAAA